MSYGPYTPGDFFVVHTGDPVGAFIRYVTRSHYNHAGVIVNESGQTVEAQRSGASLGTIDSYDNDIILIGNPGNPTDAQRDGIVTAAMHAIGTKYGFLDLASIGLLQYGIRPKLLRDIVARQTRMICSQLVTDCCTRAGVHLFNDGRLPMDVTPGDLAKLFAS